MSKLRVYERAGARVLVTDVIVRLAVDVRGAVSGVQVISWGVPAFQTMIPERLITPVLFDGREPLFAGSTKRFLSTA